MSAMQPPFLGPSSAPLPAPPPAPGTTPIVSPRTSIHMVGKYITLPFQELFVPMFDIFVKYCGGQLITIEELAKHVDRARAEAQSSVLHRVTQAVSLGQPQHGRPPVPLEIGPRHTVLETLPGDDDDSTDEPGTPPPMLTFSGEPLDPRDEDPRPGE